MPRCPARCGIALTMNEHTHVHVCLCVCVFVCACLCAHVCACCVFITAIIAFVFDLAPARQPCAGEQAASSARTAPGPGVQLPRCLTPQPPPLLWQTPAVVLLHSMLSFRCSWPLSNSLIQLTIFARFVLVFFSPDHCRVGSKGV